jgi:hypothetical protein
LGPLLGYLPRGGIPPKERKAVLKPIVNFVQRQLSIFGFVDCLKERNLICNSEVQRIFKRWCSLSQSLRQVCQTKKARRRCHLLLNKRWHILPSFYLTNPALVNSDTVGYLQPNLTGGLDFKQSCRAASFLRCSDSNLPTLTELLTYYT